MAVQVGSFERAAQTIVDRAAELLAADIAAVDERGQIVASSRPVEVGRFYDPPSQIHLDLPLQMDGRQCRIVVAQPDAEEVIPPRLTQVVVDLVVSQTTVVDRLPNKHEIKHKLILDLLHGDFENEASVLREAEVLGMDLTQPRQVLVIGAGEYIFRKGRGSTEPSEEEMARRSQIVIGAVVDFFELPSDIICAYIGEGDVALLKASNRKNMERWAASDPVEPDATFNPSWANLEAVKRAASALLVYLRSVTHASLSIGIGRYHPGLRGLASSYEDAQAALKLGRRIIGANRVHCLDGLGTASFVGVSDEKTKVDLATFLLGPLEQEPDLIQTLHSFFEHDCSPSVTAAALNVHRNTLAYRLEKIASLIGLDPRKFEEAVQIRLALILRSFEQQA